MKFNIDYLEYKSDTYLHRSNENAQKIAELTFAIIDDKQLVECYEKEIPHIEKSSEEHKRKETKLNLLRADINRMTKELNRLVYGV